MYNVNSTYNTHNIYNICNAPNFTIHTQCVYAWMGSSGQSRTKILRFVVPFLRRG